MVDRVERRESLDLFVASCCPGRVVAMKARHGALSAAGASILGACSGTQSALDPAGSEAERIAELFWWMAAGAGVVWLAVVGLSIYSLWSPREQRSAKDARLFITVGGVLFPTVVLGGLLIQGLAMLPDLLAPAPAGSTRIHVTGQQWWWRVRYLSADGGRVDLANEIHLPVGKPVEFQLESHDVIHSFWIPALGGKVDMIPGRRNRLRLEPTRTGVFHGVCAEYCGTSHALMRFAVVVEEEEPFARWLAQQAAPAMAPTEPRAAEGRELFLASGCGACHTVRGTDAAGVVGPDLTHVGARQSLGAGVLWDDPDRFRRWVAHAQDLKPGVHMPAFGMLSPEELEALAAYLEQLK
jgi:cytochrome c oxidase subunit II